MLSLLVKTKIVFNFNFQFYGPQCKNPAAYVLIVGNVVVALTVLVNLAFQWIYPTGHKAKLIELATMLVQLVILIWGGVLIFGKP